MVFRINNERLELPYPCQWTYKLIGRSDRLMNLAVSELDPPDGDYCLMPSRMSSTGKFCSFNLRCTVHSDVERKGFLRRLLAHPAIRYVL